MKLIIGLGNPGKQYAKTRHNAGWLVLDVLAQKLDSSAKWRKDANFEADIFEAQVGGEKIILAKPQTFMNNSGRSVSRLQNFYKVNGDDVVVVYDELDIDFKSVRVRFGGSSAGHNGVGSIIFHTGSEDFWRVRFGIGSLDEFAKKIRGNDFVLGRFSEEEAKVLPKIIDQVVGFMVDSLEQNNLQDTTLNI